MAITVLINGIDRSSVIDWQSLSYDEALTNQVDTVTFRTKKFGTRTFIPNPLQEVEIEVDGNKIFGGHIIKVDQDVQSVDGLVHTVTVRDYSYEMDRRLVIERYENKPLINILNDIRNRYINKIDRVEIAVFSENEIWVGGEVDTMNYRLGNQAIKVISDNNVVAYLDRLIYLNLEPNGFPENDYLEIEVFVNDINNLESVNLILSSLSDFSNDYFTADVSSQIIQTGWNLVKVNKTDFTEVGAPDWTMIYATRMEVKSKPFTNVEVTFDNYQVLKQDAFTRDGSLGATQIIKWMAFNYETPSSCLQRMAELFNWHWYVDENKDIKIFAKFDISAPFNLSDTNGNHVYRSLSINNNADQLRNSIFVRGSDYLGDQEEEDLTHQADGLNAIFKLGYKYKNVRLFQNGIEKSVGVDNLDKFDDNQGSTQLLIDGPNPANIGDITARTYASQEIIVTKHGRRSSITLRIRKVGNPVDDLQLAIYSNVNEHPGNPILSSVVFIPPADVEADFEDITVELNEAFTNSLLFDVDDRYQIRVRRSGGVDNANYYQIDTSDVAEYDGYHNEGDAGFTWTKVDSTWYFLEGIDYEILHSFLEKILIFEVPPLGGDELIFTGDPFLPVFVLYRDGASIAEFGEFQFKVIDKTIKTKDGAKQRAQQEIVAWANEVVEASFLTYKHGLKVGQTINIQSDIRGLQQDYVIQKVRGVARSPFEFEYQIQAVTTRTFSILYWLQQQIDRDDRKEEIIDNETQEKIEIIMEEFGFETEFIIDQYTGKVWGLAGMGNDLVWDGGPDHIWI